MTSLEARLLEAMTVSENEDALLTAAAGLFHTAFGADAVEILLVNRDDVVLRSSTLAPELIGRVRFPSALGLTGIALKTGEPVVVSTEVAQHAGALTYPGFDETKFDSAIYAAFGAPTGVVILRRQSAWVPSQQELEDLQHAHYTLGMTLRGYRKAFESGRKRDKLRPLSEVTSTIAGSPYLEEILQLLVNLTADQFGYRVCTVRLLDESSDELVLRATQAKMPEYQRKRSIKVGESIAGRAIAEMRPIVVRDVLNETTYIGHELAEQQGLRSMVCVPLAIQNKAIGVLTCYTDQIREFGEDELLALETIAKQSAFSIERAKLQVRNTLMQEMHHRVKNNLQQIVSLLRLQLRHKHYETIEDAINDSINRILAIAAVHDLLSRDDLDRVGLKTVAESLVHHLQQSLVQQGQLLFDVRGDDVRLTMTQATQVALVLNELVQNAIEHGFPGDKSGEIHITFESTETEVSLWVANNGRPLPPGFDILVSAHLGLQIVSNLARGLGGTFRMHDSHGWAVSEVKFQRSGSD